MEVSLKSRIFATKILTNNNFKPTLMKKIFTLIAMAAMAIGVNAETLIDFAQSQTIGIAVNGTTEISTVKIHENKDAVACIKFANSYTTEGAINDNYVTLTAEGGFKAGDVITIAGAFNNADDTKKSAVDIFTAEGTTPTVLFTTQQFINGRTVADEPVVETFTLTADAEKLYLGRNGNTGTNITILKVVRGEESTIGGDEPGGDDPTTPAGTIDFPTSKDGIAVNGTTEFSTVKIHLNVDAVNSIKFANSYTTEGAINDNYATLTVEGGFKAGDVITIAGAFNNSDESKKSAVDIFTAEGTTPTVLFTTQQFINGRTVEGEPVVETYTLEADAEILYLGRNGNTGTNITLLKVERKSTGITHVLDVKVNGAVYNLAGQKVSENYKGVVIQNGRKMIQK